MEGFFQRYLSLYRPLISRLNDLMSTYELSYSLWQVIFYIKNNGPSTLIEIANQYNVEKPTITRRVQRLEDLQIVKQIPSTNKREKVIQLTELGDEIYQVCRIKITELENSVMEGIAKEDQMITFHTLPKIQENIMKGDGSKSE
ncbi:MarR family winged helix-turn-helix transcriptional regulator [Neobacillus niacini]|uniref:MarR family winged helix-turn-helix transcriptional regulator n=1 Tax=Neobacillus niacini TaxID=86668 RepID=UPI003982F5D4